jgi:hypothetical protein
MSFNYHYFHYAKLIKILVSSFNDLYVPWLSFDLVRGSNPEGARLLDLACCLVACRHLDLKTRSHVALRLQKLAETTITSVIFQPKASESVETVQALLILALWPPAYGHGGMRDGKLLITTAISMAIDLKMDKASVEFCRLKEKHADIDTDVLEAIAAKARVVSSLMVIGLLSFPLTILITLVVSGLGFLAMSICQY